MPGAPNLYTRAFRLSASSNQVFDLLDTQLERPIGTFSIIARPVADEQAQYKTVIVLSGVPPQVWSAVTAFPPKHFALAFARIVVNHDH